MIEAFLSGSHAYGTPRPDSDIDFVCLIDQETRTKLRGLCDPEKSFPVQEKYKDRDGESLRFGNLNLIIVPNREEFEAWRQATNECIAERPVTRDFAKARIQALIEETL